MGTSPFTRLFHLKLVALLHDPPHKSRLIAKYGADYGVKHREIAKALLNSITANTSLTPVLDSSIIDCVNLIDKVASTLDRWVLRRVREVLWPSKSYVYYDKLHNIFNPRIYTELPKMDVDELEKRTSEIAIELNEILRDVDERLTRRGLEEPSKTALLYNTLYVLFESLWYAKRLPPALADTRTPTHTVFDHLYASATLANLFLFWRNVEKPHGFLVLIDFPGITKFVNSSRKASDFWASSWLLSNLMWGVAEEFARIYGLDVIVKPTPRLNPYSMRYIIASLAEMPEFEVSCINLRDDLISKICNVFKAVLGPELDSMWLQPLIPATIELVLPPIWKGAEVLDENAIKERVMEIYKRVWRHIFDYVMEKLAENAKREDAVGKVSDYIRRKLEALENVVSIPCQGLRIYIVRAEDVYDRVVRCLDGDDNACELLGLTIDRKELREVFNKLGTGAEKDVALILTWHLMISREVKLMKRGLSKAYEPVPRAFWILHVDEYGNEKLSPISRDILRDEKKEDWMHCIICGAEPAAVRLPKTFRNGRLDYSDEALSNIAQTLGLQQISQDMYHNLKQHLMLVIKPGEALGPYCLFKRAIYFVFRDRLGIVSTDDVALERISSAFNRFPKLRDKLFDGAATKLANLVKGDSEAMKSVLRHMYAYGMRERGKYQPLGIRVPFKDLEIVAEALSLNYEAFVRNINKFFEEACREHVNERSFVEMLSVFLYWLHGLPEDDRPLIALRHLVTNVVNAERVCSYLWLPTSIAIVRGDADNMGSLLEGMNVVKVDEYVDAILDNVLRYAMFIGDRDAMVKALYEGYNIVKRLLRALHLEYGVNTPTRSSVISLALMLSAMEDYRIAKNYDALLIYAGGDDVYALSPVETALSLVLKSRESFFSNGFRRINGTPITSSLVTGRSYSVRFVNLMDLLNEESVKTFELLEGEAKACRWYSKEMGYGLLLEKDSLVISDSRAKVFSVLPLKEIPIEKYINVLLLLLALKVLSSGVPEDLENLKIRDVDDAKARANMASYVIERNIVVQDRSIEKFIAEMLGLLLENVKGVHGKFGDNELDIILLLMLLIRILRRYL